MRVLICIIIAFSFFMLWKTGIQPYDESNDKNLLRIVDEINKGEEISYENSNFSIAEQLCLSWVGIKDRVNCRSGRKLDVENFDRSIIENLSYYKNLFYSLSNPVPKIKNTKKAYLSSVSFCQKQIKRLTLLRNKLDESKNTNISTSSLLVSLDHKIKYSKNELLLIKSNLITKDYIGTEDYKKLFNLLLYLEGYRYSTNSGDFKKLPWDISRVFDDNRTFSNKVQINNFFYQTSLIFLVMLPIITFVLTGSAVSAYSNLCLFLVFSFMSLGLIFTSNASINFGSTSILFELNPLFNQIGRQSIVLLIGYAILIMGFYSVHMIQKLLLLIDRNTKSASFFAILLVGVSYGFISPALGSEFLKFVVVIFASIVTFRHAKESFLSKKYLQKKNTLSNFLKIISSISKNKKIFFASEYITRYIFKSFLGLIIVSAITIGLSALVFGDLGGALILTLILIVLIFLLFGIKLAFVGISTLSIFSLLLFTTNKVKERIDLMVSPMYASVSDFARLIGFTHAAGDEGYGIRKIPWCSNEGICLPLQILSDYVPTVIFGTFGTNYGLLIFLLYCLLFLVVVSKSIYLFLIPEKKFKLVSVFVFYFATAYLIQTLLTFLGNWRIIPLSGLSVPFMSIGLSSMLFPCFIIGLFMKLSSDKN